MMTEMQKKVVEILKRDGLEYDDCFIECGCPLCVAWRQIILDKEQFSIPSDVISIELTPEQKDKVDEFNPLPTIKQDDL